MASRALWVCLLAGPLLVAADTDLDHVLKSVERRYNSAKTLKVFFTETYTVNGRARSESGELTLRKPGRMRWDYKSPAGKLFLSDGKDVYLYTPDNNRVEKMKLKESEDMRAPLAFLLGKLDFAKEFRDFQFKPEAQGFEITAKAKSDKLPYQQVDMHVAADFSIHKLVITNQDQSILTFDLSQETLNPAVADTQFRFQMPAGATLVNEEAAQ